MHYAMRVVMIRDSAFRLWFLIFKSVLRFFQKFFAAGSAHGHCRKESGIVVFFNLTNVYRSKIEIVLEPIRENCALPLLDFRFPKF